MNLKQTKVEDGDVLLSFFFPQFFHSDLRFKRTGPEFSPKLKLNTEHKD